MCLTAAATTIRSLVRIFLPPKAFPAFIFHPIHQSKLMICFIIFASPHFFLFCVFFSFFLVNPIASHFQNAPQQNLTQNYSLPASTMQANSFDASSSFHNNFNNFDQSNQFPMQYQQQQQSFGYEAGGHIQQQQQFIGQASVNNGSSSAYQHTMNDLLVQPTATLQQDLFSQNSSAVSVNQSVSCQLFFIQGLGKQSA